jgi:TonB family protein
MNIRHLLLPCVALFAGIIPGLAAEPATILAAQPGYTVTLEMRINEKGVPENIGVADSQDPTVGEIMNKMAIAMMLKRNPQFEPRIKDGHAVKYTVRVPFNFPAIEGDEGPEADKAPKPHPKLGGHKPVYPRELIEKDVVGGVILELVVNAEGKITRLTTLRASQQEFAQAATEAISGWEFAPAMNEGKPVESRCRIAVVFETKTKMAELQWRIPPRPSLGTFVIGYDDLDHPPAPAVAPAATQPGAPAFSLPPAPSTPNSPPPSAPAK